VNIVPVPTHFKTTCRETMPGPVPMRARNKWQLLHPLAMAMIDRYKVDKDQGLEYLYKSRAVVT
jgi:hypothetical protein